MDDDTRKLKGSPKRDTFKQKHKMLPGSFYAHDLDFTLVSKNPPGIVGFLDVQARGELVSFAEVLGYNELLQTAPVYLVQTDDADRGPFAIYEYLWGDWRPNPPRVRMELRASCKDWGEFTRWEAGLRSAYRDKRLTCGASTC